jgi:hypothetical protein
MNGSTPGHLLHFVTRRLRLRRYPKNPGDGRQQPLPLSTLQATSRDATCKTEGQDGVAVSFLVGLFHSLQHAGLSRRTLIYAAGSDALTGHVLLSRHPPKPIRASQ